MGIKFFTIVALLLGLVYCTKPNAATLEEKVQRSIYTACAEKWGMGTDEEVHATASCVCSINAGLNLGLYQLTFAEDGKSVDITKAEAESNGPVVYANEDELLDDLL